MVGDLTEGLVFLFTDVEGSTRTWELQPEGMRAALGRHDALLRNAIANHGGRVFKSMGDGFAAVFSDPAAAVSAAFEAQRELFRQDWQGLPVLRVRMALHTGSAEARDGDFYGPIVNRVARLLDSAHGGQILLTGAIFQALGGSLPPGCEARAVGSYRFRDLLLPEEIYQLVHPQLPPVFDRLRALAAFPHNLPTQLSSFIGREKELSALSEWLEGSRVLSLTGPGGTGKTRLALQLGAGVTEQFSDGVWLVELSPLRKADQIYRALGAALGVREDPSRDLLTTLADYLEHRRALLILDNCEHLLEECAHLVERILRHCPYVRILTTTREMLKVAGERVYPVPPLTLPTPDVAPNTEPVLPAHLEQFEAVRLFVDRAVAAHPRFALTADNAGAVVELCRQLDGLPLAIELAAARVRMLSVEQLLGRIQDRFRLLASGRRTAEERQSSLRGMIDWSYQLLTEAERELFHRVAIFRGNFDFAAVEAVCVGQGVPEEDLYLLLESLIDKSLLVAEEVEGAVRYRLLETLQAYALERLQEAHRAEEFAGKHARWYVQVAREAGDHLEGERGDLQEAAAQRLDQEGENLRAAMVWALDRDLEAALHLVRGMGLYWLRRGRWSEAAEAHERVLALRGNTPADLRAKVLRRAGIFARIRGDYRRAHALTAEALALYTDLEDTLGIAVSLYSLGTIALNRGETQEAWSYYEETLSQFRSIGRQAGIADCFQALGLLALAASDLELAGTHFQRCLEIHEELRQTTGIAIALNYLGVVAYLQGAGAEARRRYEESLAILGEGGDRVTTAVVLQNLGREARSRGDLETARSLLERSLAVALEIGSRERAAVICGDLARLDLRVGHTAAARAALEDNLGTLKQIGSRRYVAKFLHDLGEVALAEGDLEKAAPLLRESLEMRREMQHLLNLPESLEAAARFAAASGQEAKAAGLFGAVEACRRHLGIAACSDAQAALARDEERLRGQLGEDRYLTARTAGQKLAREAAMNVALALLRAEPEKPPEDSE